MVPRDAAARRDRRSAVVVGARAGPLSRGATTICVSPDRRAVPGLADEWRAWAHRRERCRTNHLRASRMFEAARAAVAVHPVRSTAGGVSMGPAALRTGGPSDGPVAGPSTLVQQAIRCGAIRSTRAEHRSQARGERPPEFCGPSTRAWQRRSGPLGVAPPSPVTSHEKPWNAIQALLRLSGGVTTAHPTTEGEPHAPH